MWVCGCVDVWGWPLGMEVVVQEELRNRSGPGRELVEGEEAVEIVEQFKKAVQVSETPLRPAPLNRNTLAEALADPNISPGPHTTELIRRQAEQALDRTPGSKRRVLAQPDAKEFLGRPYHEFKANRFLFSCADEPEGYAQNRATGWQYTLPEASGGSSSTD